MSVPQTTPPLQKSEATPPVFTCQQCGGCCSNVTVLVNAQQKETLLARPWVQQRLDDYDLALERIDKTHWGLPLKGDGTCVFLDDAQMCQIQQHDGYGAKPPDCKYFPFSKKVAAVTTIDTSAACQTVAGGLLNGIHHWQANNAESLNPEAAQLPKTIPTGYGKRLNHAEYTDWISAIRRHWTAEQGDVVSPTQALRWCQQALATNNPHYPISNIADKPLNSFVARLIPTVFGRAPYGVWTRYGVWKNDDVCDPRIFGRQGVSLTGLEQIAWPTSTESPTLNRAVCHFLFTLMQRKMPIVYGHSLQSQLLLCTVSLGLVQWYAKIFALMASQTAGVAPQQARVTSDDVVLAFRVVERYYTGHQPVFPERMRRWPFKQLALNVLLA